jgi:hypothetical protein
MQLSNEALAKDMEALGLVPDPAAIAVALKGSVFDLPLVIAREAIASTCGCASPGSIRPIASRSPRMRGGRPTPGRRQARSRRLPQQRRGRKNPPPRLPNSSHEQDQNHVEPAG